MERLPYTTADSPKHIAHDAISAEPRALTWAEDAAHRAIEEAIEQAGASECSADGVLARASVAAAAPYIAAIVLRAAAAVLEDDAMKRKAAGVGLDSRTPELVLRAMADEFDSREQVLARGGQAFAPGQYGLGGNHD